MIVIYEVVVGFLSLYPEEYFVSNLNYVTTSTLTILCTSLFATVPSFCASFNCQRLGIRNEQT
jgi:hypothetical protein